MKVLLIGLRASGKTTVGRLVAAGSGVAFVDLDDRTAAVLGVGSAADGLRMMGEAAFRAAEAAALLAVLGETGGAVVALGGGSPIAPGAAEMIREWRKARGGFVVYLAASADALQRRLAGLDPGERPPLTELGTVGEVERLHGQRDPLYRSLADRVIETEGLLPEQIAAEVARLMRDPC